MRTVSAPAPVWDYLQSAVRGHRLAGTVDHRLGPALDEYVGHVARLVSGGEMPLAEGLCLAQAAVTAAGRLAPLPEARREPR